ncbi:glycoside hydrolase family 3 protein [Nocardioides ferulae]|uniref:glycoside hydrolase family 3 protein n=1 Tax=Nocardioides ferulae TaxID=2340821 RepID=UPI000EB3FB56|nr:glycoside hydrolase family 3 N-terminal domain-containing protein [Nocardioides ferulae]
MTRQLRELALRVQLAAFPGTTPDDDARTLLAEGLGGVCLFGSNTADGPDAVAAYAAAVHAASPTALVSVDEEGGDVTRLHVTDGSPVPGPAALGRIDDLATTRAVGRAVGAELAELGVDLDLAPVADVNSNPDNPVIGTRSFGAEPERVAAHVAAWIDGLQEAGVAACAKHFPGHGDTDADSHLALPRVEADPTTLEARELAPFRTAVAAGARAVMTSHILVPALDPDRPATLSPVVLGLLRHSLSFGGAIVTDALDMAGASAGRGIPEAAVQSLAAGADLLCLGADKDAGLVRAVQAAIVDAVRSGRLAEQRLRDAADRAGRLRVEDRPGSAAAGPASDVVPLLRRALVLEGRLPVLAGARVVTVATAANIAIGEAVWGLPTDHVVVPGGPLDLPGPDDGTAVVVQARDAARHPEVGAVLDALRRARPDRPVLVVEWGWPGTWTRPEPRLCTYGSSRPAVVAVTETLREAGWDR